MKRVFGLVVCVFAIIGLAGCDYSLNDISSILDDATTNQDESNVTTGSDLTNNITTDDIVTTEGTTTGSAETVNISFWHIFGSEKQTVLRNILAAFMAENPDIVVTDESKSTYDDLKKQVVLDMQTGNTPDVVLGYPDHFAEYISGSALVPLSSYFVNDSEAQALLADIYPYYLKENYSFDDQGTIYGLPFNKSSEVMVYNQSLFEFLDLEIPTTWQEVSTVAASMRTKMVAYYGTRQEFVDSTGESIVLDFTEVTADNFVPFAYDSQANFFITTTYQWGGEYTQRGETLKKGKILYNNDEVKSAMGFFDQLATDKLFTTPAFWNGGDYASDAFTSLQCAMTVGSTAGVTYNVPDGDPWTVGISAVPYNADEPDLKYVIQQGTNIAMMANNTQAERDAAFKLIKYLLRPEVNAYFALATGYFPVTKSAYSNDAYQSFLVSTGSGTKEDAKVAAANVAFLYNVSTEDGGYGYTPFVDPAFVGSSQIRENLVGLVNGYIVGDKTIEGTISETIDKTPAFK